MKRLLMSAYKPCPKCQAVNAEMVSFTWWGGVLGPHLLTHVKCQSCGTAFNGKTGKSNDQAIAIYLGVGLFIGIVAGVIGASMK
jgi:hypothetical protein